jgi:hypothetical protein
MKRVLLFTFSIGALMLFLSLSNLYYEYSGQTEKVAGTAEIGEELEETQEENSKKQVTQVNEEAKLLGSTSTLVLIEVLKQEILLDFALFDYNYAEINSPPPQI